MLRSRVYAHEPESFVSTLAGLRAYAAAIPHEALTDVARASVTSAEEAVAHYREGRVSGAEARRFCQLAHTRLTAAATAAIAMGLLTELPYSGPPLPEPSTFAIDTMRARLGQAQREIEVLTESDPDLMGSVQACERAAIEIDRYARRQCGAAAAWAEVNSAVGIVNARLARARRAR